MYLHVLVLSRHFVWYNFHLYAPKTMLDIISVRTVELQGIRSKWKLQNEQFFLTAGLDTISEMTQISFCIDCIINLNIDSSSCVLK